MGTRSYIKKKVWSMAKQMQRDLEGGQRDSWSEFLMMQIIQQMSGTLTVPYYYYIPLFTLPYTPWTCFIFPSRQWATYSSSS